VGGIEYLVVRVEPLDADFAGKFVPEALGVVAGEGEESFAIGEAEAVHEAKDVGGTDELGRGIPHGLSIGLRGRDGVSRNGVARRG